MVRSVGLDLSIGQLGHDARRPEIGRGNRNRDRRFRPDERRVHQIVRPGGNRRFGARRSRARKHGPFLRRDGGRNHQDVVGRERLGHAGDHERVDAFDPCARIADLLRRHRRREEAQLDRHLGADVVCAQVEAAALERAHVLADLTVGPVAERRQVVEQRHLDPGRDRILREEPEPGIPRHEERAILGNGVVAREPHRVARDVAAE